MLGDGAMESVSELERRAIVEMIAGVKPLIAMCNHGLKYVCGSKDYRRVKQVSGVSGAN